MLTFFTIIGSIALVGICGWIIFLILMQKPSSNAGMGASLGGGIAEAAFGGEASHVLTRLTVYGIIGFFACTLLLSLAHIYRYHHRQGEMELKPMEETTAQSLTQLPTGSQQPMVDATPSGKKNANVGPGAAEPSQRTSTKPAPNAPQPTGAKEQRP